MPRCGRALATILGRKRYTPDRLTRVIVCTFMQMDEDVDPSQYVRADGPEALKYKDGAKVEVA
jgi:hypothetical protein